MPLAKIKEKLEAIGCEVTVSANSTIVITYNEKEKSMDVSTEWLSEIKAFNRSTQFDFETGKRKLIGPKSIEIGISRLDNDFFGRPNHEFTAGRSRKVRITPASKRFALYFFHSEEYKDFFEVIVANKFKRDRDIKFENLFWFLPTIEFSVPRKTDKSKLLDEGLAAIEACLFKLAVEKGECWDFSKKRKRRQFILAMKGIIIGKF